MNPVNATALYISASRLVLNYDPGDPKAFTEINRLLPYFRQSLSCCVCGSPTKTVYKKPQEKKGCKCGRATQNPSVLTCRGQRCPCYSNRKACLDCICRGCQNSYMANGEKKLEAFAVPEKALEQTRLTLGINVTSIAVRNASTSTSDLITHTCVMEALSYLLQREQRSVQQKLLIYTGRISLQLTIS
ncbi:hypothetical protein GH733_002641 [Mirounga leonina]|nr:hypothetical protein GH733_002641 [Mirounga leonina]